ncbi:hypothetical protein BDF21DRAFT_397090 [Thamnidium elegans]|nr:hypothetical protein BDF21DRAFT_397090 [Thamnidium elegans]
MDRIASNNQQQPVDYSQNNSIGRRFISPKTDIFELQKNQYTIGNKKNKLIWNLRAEYEDDNYKPEFIEDITEAIKNIKNDYEQVTCKYWDEFVIERVEKKSPSTT